MPVRDKAVDRILREAGLRMAFNNADYTARVNGETMTRDEFDKRFWDPADRIYERVVDTIDWNRVLLEASARHAALNHEDWLIEDICPDCLCEALLLPSTFASWARTPRTPRHEEGD